jgi:hypothetical protein
MGTDGALELVRDRGGYRVDLLREPGPARTACERELAGAGVPLPLTSRNAWALARPSAVSWFLAVRGGNGACVGGLALDVAPSRALPGRSLLRAVKVGSNLPPGSSRAAAAGLAALARRDRRVLRVNVELLARDAGDRDRLGADLAAEGFRTLPELKGYRSTIAVDLTPPDEEAVFASFSRSTRRNVREVGKLPVRLRPVDSLRYAGRLDALLRESMGRTGGRPRAVDWPAVIGLSRAEPSLARLVGLFHDGREAPDDLLAFAWGCCHGDHGHYDLGGSTRDTGGRIALAYPLLWDLIRWAKGAGCRWFDLGGVTPGAHGGDDPVGGISDFKRGFSKAVVEVGEEWAFEPRAIPAMLARAVSTGHDWVSHLRRLPR